MNHQNSTKSNITVAAIVFGTGKTSKGFSSQEKFWFNMTCSFQV